MSDESKGVAEVGDGNQEEEEAHQFCYGP